MKDIEINEKNLKIFLILVAASFYFLEGVPLNPAIIWTGMPLYIGFLTFKSAYQIQSQKRLYSAVGFLAVIIASGYLYHLAWYLDWSQIKTGSSTSGLVFMWFPIYSTILGYISYFLVWVFFSKIKGKA